MHQIKIFKNLESEISVLEKQVNHWLAETHVRVINIFGNISPQTAPVQPDASTISLGSFPPSDILLVVVYEKE